MSDPDLAWIFQQGCKDYGSLSQKERARFLHYEDKSINKEVWEYNRLIFLAYAAQPGAKHYWSQRKPTFDPGFRKIVDEITSSELAAGHIITEMELPDLSVDSEKET